jgi:hypothetical protein
MAIKTPTGELSGLAYYLKEMLLDNWKTERSDLEQKYEDNLNAFNAISKGKWKVEEAEGWRSKTFIKKTKIKVVAAYAMVIDILLQGGRIPFSLLPSPWDKIVFEDMSEEEQEPIKDAISDMEGLIRQQFIDSQADLELMKNIFSSAIYGETYAKWLVHDVVRKGYDQIQYAPGIANQDQYVRYEPTKQVVVAPAWRYVSVWNIFRDLETNDLQSCVGIMERNMVSKYDLFKRQGAPFWIDKALKKAVEESPPEGDPQHQGDSDTASLPPNLRDRKHRHRNLEEGEFWCRVPTQILEHFEWQLQKDEGKSVDRELFEYDDFKGDETEIMAVLSGDQITRYTRNEDGYRPYCRAEWEMKLDQTGANGVADNLEDIQMVLNGMVRAMEDNLKLSANVILAIKKNMFAPGEKGDVKPGKEYEMSDEVEDVRKALQQIIIQPVVRELFVGIPLLERFADEATMLPRIIQGMVAEKQKPDTLGEMNILQANAGKYLGSVLKNHDEGIVEPMVTWNYEYNMADPNIQRGKGNFIAKAMGFNSFQDKFIRGESMRRLLALVLSDEKLASEWKTAKLVSEIAKTDDLDPDEFEKTDEEKQKEQEQAMELRAQEEARVRKLTREQMQLETEKELVEKEVDHEHKLEEKDQEHEHDLEEQELKHEHELEESGQEFVHDLALKRAGGTSQQ